MTSLPKLAIFKQLLEEKWRHRLLLASMVDFSTRVKDIEHLRDEEKRVALDKIRQEQSSIVRELNQRYSTMDFECIRKIGHGAFGIVSLVTCKRTGRQCALKQIKKDAMLKKNHRDRILAEKSLLSSWGRDKSDWVVKLYHTFQDVQNLYMVMEYLPGGDLMSHLIRLDTFTEDQTRFYMAELIQAVHSIHRMGFIHRDIKPDNIVLTVDGHLRLIDFGLCKFDSLIKLEAIASDDRVNDTVTAAEQTNRSHPSVVYPQKRSREGGFMAGHILPVPAPFGLSNNGHTCSKYAPQHAAVPPPIQRVVQLRSSVGTPQYMAPEVLGKCYSQMSDFWSVGMISYECLMGGTPFYDEHAETRPGKKPEVKRILHKVIHYKEFLPIPYPGKSISAEAVVFLKGLLCEAGDRMRYEQLKRLAFFAGLPEDWGDLRRMTPPRGLVVENGGPTTMAGLKKNSEPPLLPTYQPMGVMKDRNMDFVGYTYDRYKE